MAEESIQLDKDEVLAHLKHILGSHIQITDEELNIFMHNLKKLIQEDQNKLLLTKEDLTDICTCNCHLHSVTSTDIDTDSVVSCTSAKSDEKTARPKPASSFIRPWNVRPVGKNNSEKNLKEDPVRLYHYYQNAWQKQRFPGESGHSDLRWTVREKMLGQDPQPRPVSRLSTQR